MKSESFKLLKSKINILNDLNDKINLIEWNKDDGPKFESVEEMKEFEKKVINGDFEFVLDDNIDIDNNTILKDYKTTKDNYFFYIYTTDIICLFIFLFELIIYILIITRYKFHTCSDDFLIIIIPYIR